ncbi:MAG: hypothetical protein ABSB74_19370 [Tepidisphaeraceae bacterium]
MKDKDSKDRVLDLIQNSEPFLHWGRWVKARSLRVGFRRQVDFALAVGCERTQLYKWFAMEFPPASMKKGFDRSIATALKTDRQTLFNGWRFISAEDAPVAGPDFGDEAFAERQLLLDALSRMVPVLRNDGLKALVEQGRREIEKIAGLVDERMRREESRPKPPHKK